MSRQQRTWKFVLIVPVALFGLVACAHFAMMKAAPKPPASEFGYGPRTTTNGAYRVAIEETAKYKTGKMLSTVIHVTAAGGGSVDGAQITVDGGMPQHGHGLPTRPRVSKNLGGGRYQVDGLKFNMAGWWELKFAISNQAVRDSVTFNLEL